MWSHYGKSHTGYCFEIEKTGDTLNKGGPLLLPIYYCSERSIINTIDTINLACWGALQDNKVADKVRANQTAKSLALEKSKEWEYECEWRLVAFGGHSGYKHLKGYSVSAIILGANMSEKDTKTMSDIVADRIPIKRCKIGDHDYKIEIN